jgi:hypothetical protein
MLPTFIFQPRKVPHRRPRTPTPSAPPATLVLVSANYDETVPVLTLIFDRAIDASRFVAGQVIVNDGSLNMGVYGGVGPATVDARTRISVALTRLADAPLAPATLTATALTGLTAVDDGGTWAGVSDVGLPFDG